MVPRLSLIYSVDVSQSPKTHTAHSNNNSCIKTRPLHNQIRLHDRRPVLLSSRKSGIMWPRHNPSPDPARSIATSSPGGSRILADPFASPSSSRSQSVAQSIDMSRAAATARPKGRFKSSKLVGPYEKPWLKDPKFKKTRWNTAIVSFWATAGIVGAGLYTWFNVKDLGEQKVWKCARMGPQGRRQ